jgi:predicted ATP-grasp superfamily ATP-dependent carboligase
MLELEPRHWAVFLIAVAAGYLLGCFLGAGP